MSRLLDAFETVVSPGYRLFGLVDTALDEHVPEADRSKWLLSAPGMVHLRVPPQVIEVAVRLESWSAPPPRNDAQWFGQEEVEVELPGGDLAIETIDGGLTDVPLSLPSPGLYTMRWQWIFHGDRGVFTSPLRGGAAPLPIPPGERDELNGKDQYCLVQIWRVPADVEGE